VDRQGPEMSAVAPPSIKDLLVEGGVHHASRCACSDPAAGAPVE
jgi:hypothetical protein